MISQERLKYLFSYKDGKLFWKQRSSKFSYSVKIGQEAGGSGPRYDRIRIDGKLYKTHRLIYLYHYGYSPKYIDHINGDTFDNHIENLRECTHQENMYNYKTPSTNKSGIKGVSWSKKENKWISSCRLNGKKIRIGSFIDINDAEKSVKEFREKYHGEFVRHI